jgi:Fe2+ transport system protein FeoA
MNNMLPNNLARLTAGQSGTVAALRGHPTRIQRLAEMGLLPCTLIRMIRTAPLGDPMEFEVLGYRLSLRRDDARDVELS